MWKLKTITPTYFIICVFWSPVSVCVCVRNPFFPKLPYNFLCLLARSFTFRKLKKGRFRFFDENSNLALFCPINGQNCPFLAKNACFDLFLVNVFINVLNFHHRNIFFGLFKNYGNYFGRKNLKIDFLDVFLTKFDHFVKNMFISAYFFQTLL